MPLKDHPLFLLLATGMLLGLYFPMGKLAAAAGLDPILWAMVISLGPGILLAIISFVSDRSSWQVRTLPFAFFSGILAYVIPNAISFAALPHIGSGLVSLMFAFSPVFTAALSMLVGVRPPNGRLLAGVAFGFAGAVLIVSARNSLDLGGNAKWLLIAFLVPLSLACGNVFRTAFWPQGMAPLRMAAVTNLMAAIPLFILLAATSGFDTLGQLAAEPFLFLLQVLISAAMFSVFFRLQWVGGPTYLSQIGYVAAAVGLGAGVLLLGEKYPLMVWAGAAAIGIGIVVSNWPKRGAAEKSS